MSGLSEPRLQLQGQFMGCIDKIKTVKDAFTCACQNQIGCSILLSVQVVKCSLSAYFCSLFFNDLFEYENPDLEFKNYAQLPPYTIVFLHQINTAIANKTTIGIIRSVVIRTKETPVLACWTKCCFSCFFRASDDMGLLFFNLASTIVSASLRKEKNNHLLSKHFN